MDTLLLAFILVGQHGAPVIVGVKAFVEGGFIQTQRNRKRFQGLIAEAADVLTALIQEQRIVIGPELTLLVGALRCLGRSV